MLLLGNRSWPEIRVPDVCTIFEIEKFSEAQALIFVMSPMVPRNSMMCSRVFPLSGIKFLKLRSDISIE